jgi:hypothetical protein
MNAAANGSALIEASASAHSSTTASARATVEVIANADINSIAMQMYFRNLIFILLSV